jgi:5'-AMP-activated protein kinase catalytic alpha subunit
LKAENILITEEGLVKISDFGLSAFCEPYSNLDMTIQMTGPNLNHTTCGTMNYIAPELIKNHGYDG